MTNANLPAQPMRQWGLVEPGELERVVVVSPHLDDAVLGCARLLGANPGAAVVTVFAGNPDAYPDPMRPWDVQSGFEPGDDVMAVRRAEDTAALETLGAVAVHLDGVEYSYRPGDRPMAPEDVVEFLAPALAALRPTVVLTPFGLANPDHDVTHRACMLARDRLGAAVSWWCYEDHGYKHIPGMLAWRVSSLFRRNVWPTPVCPVIDADETRKQRAIACYPTQLRALEDDWAISQKLAAPAPEQYWRLAPPPPGWDRLADG
jgi:LmbE family N-acetylglucosaminyl deacetylase